MMAKARGKQWCDTSEEVMDDGRGEDEDEGKLECSTSI